jgi:hypothetical protein
MNLVKNAEDIVRGLWGEYTAANKRAGGQNFPAQPDVQFTPQNLSQKIGVFGEKSLSDFTVAQNMGINQAFEGATKSLMATPEAEYVTGIIGDKIKSLLPKKEIDPEAVIRKTLYKESSKSVPTQASDKVSQAGMYDTSKNYPKIYHATTEQNVDSMNAMGVRSDLKKLYFASDENVAKGYGKGVIALNENHFQVLPSTSPRAKAFFEQAGVDPSMPHVNDKLMNILKSEGYDGIKYPTTGDNWDYEIFNTAKINKSINSNVAQQPLSVSKGVGGESKTFYHVTSSENATKIRQEGFKPQIGERSTGVSNAKGTWLYENADPTGEFGKNFTRAGKTPEVVETTVKGKIFDGINDDRSIRALAEDKNLINRLKSEGYVGIRGDEMGTPATFIFEPKAISIPPTQPKGVGGVNPSSEILDNPTTQLVNRVKSAIDNLKPPSVDDAYKIRQAYEVNIPPRAGQIGAKANLPNLSDMVDELSSYIPRNQYLNR